MNDKSLRARMSGAYLNSGENGVVLGIYSRFLPRGKAERLERSRGIGIIEYFPPVSLIAPPWHLLPGFLSEVKNTGFRIENKWESGRLQQNRVLETPVGELNQIVESDAAGTGSEHICKHYLCTREDYRVMQYVVENTVLRSNDASFGNLEKQIGDDGVVLARLDRCGYQKLLIELAGAEKFHMDLFDFPGVVEELIQVIDSRGEEQFRMVLETGAQLLWQPDNVTSDMTPPDYFKKYIRPIYESRQRMIGTDRALVTHMDGRLSALTGELNMIGPMIIESFSLPEIGGDIELADAGSLLSPHRIFPNFPSNWCMLTGEELAVRCEQLKSDLAELGYPLILQVSEDLPDFAYQRVLPVLTEVFNG